MVNTEIRLTNILYSQRWRSSIQSEENNNGSCYCSDHELIGKFGLELKKVGKTTSPFRYDLHQIPYDYSVGVTNRFKDLMWQTECWKNYGWSFITLYRRWWSKPSLRKRMQKCKMIVWGGLTIPKKRGERQRKSIPIW